jgi:Recombinase
LIATSLDCVAWSLPQLLSLLTALHERKIAFRALDNPIDTSGMNGAIILDTIRALLSFDDTLAKSRIRRDPLPNPRTPRREIVEMVAKLASERPGRRLRQIAAELKSLGYTPPQGGDHWAPTTVKRLLQQAKMTGLLIKK